MDVFPLAIYRYDHRGRPPVSMPLLLPVVAEEHRVVHVGPTAAYRYRALPPLPADCVVVPQFGFLEHVGMIRRCLRAYVSHCGFLEHEGAIPRCMYAYVAHSVVLTQISALGCDHMGRLPLLLL